MRKKTVIIILLFILALGAFLRFYGLDSVPPGFYPDEAVNANDALKGEFKVFYPDNNGREGLFIWLLSFSYYLFGASVWSFRLVPAFFGTLTILGTYLLAKELFKKEKIALLSSFFLAISFWHINFSRIGFRAILMPLLMSFGFYFLFKGFKGVSKKKIYYLHLALAGVFLGLGFYTYISYRFVVVLGLIVLFSWFLMMKKDLGLFSKAAAVLLIFVFLSSLPIGYYFFLNTEDFFGRAGGVSVFSHPEPLKKLGESVILHLGMFNFYGDGNWRHNFSESPLLFWPVGILFLLGLFYSLKEFIYSLKRKDCSLFMIHFFLLSWFLIMLLPGFLSAEGIPHALRVLGVIPPVYILCGLSCNWLIEKMPKKKLVLASLAILALVLAFFQANKYFYNWAKRPEVESAFSKDLVDVGNYLNSECGEKYVFVYPVTVETLKFLEKSEKGQIKTNYLLPNEIDKIKIEKEGLIVVITKEEKGLLLELHSKFPEAKTEKIAGFWVFKIKQYVQ